MSEARKMIPEEQEQEEELQEVACFDDASAEYLLKRRKEAIEQYERMEAWYEGQKAKAKALMDRTVNWADRNLRAYFEMVPKKKSKTQLSYDLPGGKLVMKDPGPKYDSDDPAFLEWLKKNDLKQFIEVKESPKWGDFKKTLKDENGEIRITKTDDGLRVVTEDGEIVPGVKVIPREPEFKVTNK